MSCGRLRKHVPSPPPAGGRASKFTGLGSGREQGLEEKAHPLTSAASASIMPFDMLEQPARRVRASQLRTCLVLVSDSARQLKHEDARKQVTSSTSRAIAGHV
eukprot:jgi/Mesvir1/6133/Mv00837-RA.1